jgi:transcription-repair coupling factor (superfamily II helicase)
MPDVHQRLYFYKRFAQAAGDEELDEIRAEIVDRYGDPPDEVDALQALMQVKVRLRELRIRALEAGPGRLVFALGEAPALDSFQLAKKVQSSQGALRLTPDMKLVVHVGPDGRIVAPPPRPATTRPPSAAAARTSRAEKVAAAVAKAVSQARPSPAAPPPAPTPAQEAAQGRELLVAVRRVLDELARLAA